MLPLLAINDFPYMGLMNAKYFRYFSFRKALFIEGLNFYDICIIKNAVRIFTTIYSSFFRLIFAIVRVGSNKKMVWIYTRRIVTPMKNMKIVWNFSKMNLPGDPMGSQAFFIKPEISIPIFVYGSNPFPAGMKRDECNFVPKCLHKGDSICLPHLR